MALVRERTIPTERPPPVGEVSANFCGYIPTDIQVQYRELTNHIYCQACDDDRDDYNDTACCSGDKFIL